MAYVPDVSGFMKPFGEADSLLEILERDVPRQLVLKYARDDISGFSPDMSISIKAEHGYRIRVSADGRLYVSCMWIIRLSNNTTTEMAVL